MIRIIVAATAMLALFASTSFAENFGSFMGRVAVTWNDDGRTMTLLEPFAYVDPQGLRWEAPAGTKVDGASIPQFAWSIIGGPFEGKYRAPSIIHDVACNEKKHDWQDVHLMFRNGMLASGVDPRLATIMYAAVYHFGPRWPRQLIAQVKAATADELDAIKSQLTAATRKHERSGEIVRTAATRSVLGGNMVVVEYQPEPPRLSPADFEALRVAILLRNLTPEEVENFKPRAAR